MSDKASTAGEARQGMSPAAARRVEWAVIGLGLLALALIFQPFSLALFGVGCALVVLAGLANNLLPLCQPGTAYSSLANAALIVALEFFVVMLISITAASLYGFFSSMRLRPTRASPSIASPSSGAWPEWPSHWLCSSPRSRRASADRRMRRKTGRKKCC